MNSENLELEVRRLRGWLTALTLVSALLLWMIAMGYVFYLKDHPGSLDGQTTGGVESAVQGETVTLTAVGSGPYLVTHLVAQGDAELDTWTAALPEPAVVLNGSRPVYTTGLPWRDANGELAKDGPETGVRITAIYQRMERTP